MNELHHTEIKEIRTTKLLEKILGLLIKSKTPIKLNNKEYKKINFSHSQIINALFQLSSNEEKSDGIVISNPSTISKNPKYKKMVENAKIAKKERDSKNISFSVTGNIELDYMQLKEDLEVLKYKYCSLIHENKCLNQIIKKAEFKNFNTKEFEKTNNIINSEKSYHEIFKHLIELLLNDYHLIITPSKNGKQGFVSYITMDGNTIRLCSFGDIKEFNIPINLY
ncbi:hypothetical protein [Aliarcobacter butzleri]|uniref:hypothetical protein n=1 Tax=Aliarcobacter butzleri TaxID=28197 RepID=UPI003AF5D0FA